MASSESHREITVDEAFITKAAIILNDAWDEVCLHPERHQTCLIKDCIDLVFVEKPTKTWPYILMTQLLGKATDARVNILAMHKSSTLDGAWDARSLCEHVISREGCFEQTVLSGVLGSVKQPYNNSPGQKPELSKDNKTSAAHVPIRNAVIDALTRVDSPEMALSCLHYVLWVCKKLLSEMVQDEPFEELSACQVNLATFKLFLSDLAEQGRDGEGLGVAVALVLSMLFREDSGYTVNLYQSNTSRKGRDFQGDLEIYQGSEKYASLELKDKPFSLNEVISAARLSEQAGFPRFLFVYGRGAGDAEELSHSDLLQQGNRGVFRGCVGVTQLIDSLLLVMGDIDLEEVRHLTVRILEEARVKARTQTIARKLLRGLVDSERQKL